MDPLAHKWHPPSYPLSHITKGERKKGNIQSILKKVEKRLLECKENLPSANKVTPLGYYNPNYNSITTLLAYR